MRLTAPHLLLQNRLYVETLLPDGRPAAPGGRGEITLTGGFNFYLPLLRYRTGDWATLEMSASGPLLRELIGRPPVRFLTPSGQWLNNVDLTHAMAPCGLPQYTVHQHADLSLRVRIPSQEEGAPALEALRQLFGPDHPIQLESLHGEGKVIQYTSDVPDA